LRREAVQGHLRTKTARRAGAKAEVLPLQIEAARLRVPVEVVGLEKAWARLDTGCASALHWAVSTTVFVGQSSSEELGVGVSSILERFKKYCSHSERGFLGFGEASAKEHARSGL
jgi:hypothetical protein